MNTLLVVYFIGVGVMLRTVAERFNRESEPITPILRVTLAVGLSVCWPILVLGEVGQVACGGKVVWLALVAGSPDSEGGEE